MKIIIALFATLASFGVFSQIGENQKPRGIIDYHGSNVFYRGIEYQISAIAHGVYDETILEGINADVKKDSSRQYGFTVIFGDSSIAKIGVYGKHNGRKAALSLYIFEVRDKPEPSIYLDNLKSGSSIDTTVSFIECRYPEEVNLEESFEVISWNFQIGEQHFSGDSNVISRAFKNELSLAKKNTVIIARVTIANKDEPVIGLFIKE